MSFNLDDYTPVSERILEFYRLHPNGVISTQPAKLVEVAGAYYVSVITRIYLDTGSEAGPIVEAEAWEPYPGKTPYTRDSEQMNAATSSIGRALMQLGIGITAAGAASREEVQVARERQQLPAQQDARYSKAKGSISEKQRGYMLSLAAKKGFRDLEELVVAAEISGKVPEGTDHTQLTSAEASDIIEWLKGMVETTGKTTVSKTPPPIEEDIWATGYGQ